MRRQLEGIVISTRMQKTAVVRVDRTLIHPKYRKRFTRSKKYLVHDPASQAKDGQKVVIQEARPLSKKKRWIFVSLPDKA